jgi:acyl-CoA reductase-like NAD-dependent aldehyde dehydrogenase
MLETASDPVAEYVGDRQFRLLIGGELSDASDGGTYDTYDPSTGKVLAQAPLASPQDVERAVEAAKGAQPGWNELGVRGRREAFERLAAAVEANAEELALLDAIDGGNPIDAMRFDLKLSVWNIRDWPGLALALTSDVIPEASPGRNLHYTLYQPYGVVGRIVPFNHPAMFAITRILPALIAGNSVVLKPGEQTPLSALRFGEIAAEVLPAGVLNIVTGGLETGDALVTHPAVKRIAFTGSTRTAMAIQQRVAQFAIKHLSLELGGKNAMVVFPDADVEAVVKGAVEGMNMTVCQGQSCGSNSRVFVHRRLYEDYLALLREELDAIRVGPAYDPASEMGPVVSEAHRERIMGYIDSAKRDGARLVAGGGAPPGVNGGYFVAPTAFGDVEMRMTIAREEIFGPVISVLPWDDYETMIAEANAVEYGLTASVWTHDLDIAHRTVQRLDAGYIWINDSSKHYWGTPFGGTKQSGLGREESTEELISYYELKAVHTMLGDADAALARLDSR